MTKKVDKQLVKEFYFTLAFSYAIKIVPISDIMANVNAERKNNWEIFLKN